MNILETNLHVFSPFSNAQVKIYTVVSQGLLIQYFITMEFTFIFRLHIFLSIGMKFGN